LLSQYISPPDGEGGVGVGAESLIQEYELYPEPKQVQEPAPLLNDPEQLEPPHLAAHLELELIPSEEQVVAAVGLGGDGEGGVGAESAVQEYELYPEPVQVQEPAPLVNDEE